MVSAMRCIAVHLNLYLIARPSYYYNYNPNMVYGNDNTAGVILQAVHPANTCLTKSALASSAAVNLVLSISRSFCLARSTDFSFALTNQ